nr:MAG TPA: Rubredoxin loop, ELECTRON TRANSPORT [Bacteriophage sp.]
MKYKYKCDCGNEKIIECSIKEIENREEICEKCGCKMKRDWKASLIIPEHMKTSNSQEMSYVKNILKTRPSGKNKVYY